MQRFEVTGIGENGNNLPVTADSELISNHHKPNYPHTKDQSCKVSMAAVSCQAPGSEGSFANGIEVAAVEDKS